MRTVAAYPNHRVALALVAFAAAGALGCAHRAAPAAAPATPPAPASAPSPAPAAQNPSPMVESTRAHGRVAPHAPGTQRITLDSLLPRPVELHLPAWGAQRDTVALLVHFLGPDYIAVDAARCADSTMLVAVVNLAPGSSAYERPFKGTDGWRRLLGRVVAEASRARGRPVTLGDIYLSAFSAGNGAVRAILADSLATPAVRGAVILDGIHTGYLPDRRVLADSGTLDPANLQSIVRFAERAMRDEVRLLVTHSEVFPGTFASTTETADWLLRTLGLRRSAVLAWGPNGMQQLSQAQAASFTLMGFAGNSAPDHLDHLHALPAWLALVVKPSAAR
ncbi:MAG: hypothetical protein U0164_12430 [Gemmatimonadaceae bacterium]